VYCVAVCCTTTDDSTANMPLVVLQLCCGCVAGASQRVAVCCSALHCARRFYSSLATCCVAVVLQLCCRCVAACCIVLQCKRRSDSSLYTCLCEFLIDICDMTHSQVCHDSFTYVIWHIHMCATMWATTHSHVCHDSFICVPWFILICDRPTTATHYCNTLLQHTTATHYCNTLLQHPTATHIYGWVKSQISMRHNNSFICAEQNDPITHRNSLCVAQLMHACVLQ